MEFGNFLWGHSTKLRWCGIHTRYTSNNNNQKSVKSVPWVLTEFHHNRIVQSPHENYFNVCRQHKEK